MFLTLPTILTWARIAAIPLIAGVFHLPFDDATRNIVATAMFSKSAAAGVASPKRPHAPDTM